MLKGQGDITAARAATDSRLMRGEGGLDSRADQVHDGTAEEPAKAAGELEGTLSIDSVGHEFFSNPQ